MKFQIIEELSNFNFGSEFVNAGRAFEKKITAKDVDPKELEMGILVEMEHTTNRDIATKIALDHLSEIKDYYTRLKKMEEKAKKQQEEKKEEESEKDEESDKDDKEDDKEDEEEKEKDSKNSMKV
jgi:hypothetical protein